MIKAFYKRTKPIKTFFSKNVRIRSTAYGEGVHEEFLQWLGFFAKSLQSFGTGFRLSVEKRPEGAPLAAQSAAVGGELPVLCLSGNTYTLSTSGQVLINGNPSPLNVGTEIKAWAIAANPHPDGQQNTLFVIGKPHNTAQMMLAGYPIKSGIPQATPRLLHELPITLQASSYLVCLGKHILAVHDSCLHYFHYLPDTGELERVAIGADTTPAAKPWGRHLYPLVVATQSGEIYWRTERHIYGFTVGYPGKLITVTVPHAEQLVHICADKKDLQIHYRNKNTNALTTVSFNPSSQPY